MSLAGFPPVVVPEIAKVWVDASSSATKNDGSDGAVMCDPVIAACATGVAGSAPNTTATASTAAAAALIPPKCTEPP